MNDYDDETEKALEYYRSHRKRLEFWEKVKSVAAAMAFVVVIVFPLLIVLTRCDAWIGEFWKGIVMGGMCTGTFAYCLSITWKMNRL